MMNIVQKYLQKYFNILPLIYLFVCVFMLRSSVKMIYLASAVLIILTFIAQYKHKLDSSTKLARWMIVLACIGLSSAVILSIEKVEILSQPEHIASCSLSPIVACSPVIKSPQASAFGFANPFIGIFGFSTVLTAGMTILAGARNLKKAWWRTLLGGITFGAVFCSWLFYQGVFNIGKLCLYCTLVWIVTFTLLWFVSAYCVSNKYINLGSNINSLLLKKNELVVATIAIILMLVFYRWSNYWLSLF